MKKIISKDINPKVIFGFCATLSTVALIVCAILYENNELINVMSHFSTALCSFVILGSLVYSSSIINNDLFYSLSFGLGRKKVYINYIQILIKSLIVTICYILIITIMIWILCGFKGLIQYHKNIHLLSVISLFVFLNMILFNISVYIHKFNDIYFYVFVFILGIIIFILDVTKYLGYFSLLILGIGLLLGYYNYLYIKKVKVQKY